MNVALARYISLPLAAASYGWTVKAIRRRMERGVWVKDVHWRKVHGRIVIDTKAVDKWLETGPA